MYNYQATVVRVIDGDTVRLRVDVGFSMTYEANFRLKGINAPELRKDGVRGRGEEAQSEFERLLQARQTWEITTYRPDPYGRWLVDIHWSDDKTINGLMVELGLADVY